MHVNTYCKEETDTGTLGDSSDSDSKFNSNLIMGNGTKVFKWSLKIRVTLRSSAYLVAVTLQSVTFTKRWSEELMT